MKERSVNLSILSCVTKQAGALQFQSTTPTRRRADIDTQVNAARIMMSEEVLSVLSSFERRGKGR
jgi:hypothetical protein